MHVPYTQLMPNILEDNILLWLLFQSNLSKTHSKPNNRCCFTASESIYLEFALFSEDFMNEIHMPAGYIQSHMAVINTHGKFSLSNAAKEYLFNRCFYFVH